MVAIDLFWEGDLIAKFGRLYWLIFTEHWKVQLFMYLVIFLFAFLYTGAVGIEAWQSCLISAFLCLGIKFLSAASSLLKSLVIILGCSKGNLRFLSIYSEWTGNNY